MTVSPLLHGHGQSRGRGTGPPAPNSAIPQLENWAKSAIPLENRVRGY